MSWKRHFQRAWYIYLALWVGLASWVDSQGGTSGKDAGYPLRFLKGNGQYANSDSGDVVKICPQGEDTTSNCQTPTWIGADISLWMFYPDSSEVYAAYVNDTLVTHFTNQYMLSTQASDGFISSSEALGAGVVTSPKLATDAAWDNLAASGTKAELTQTMLSAAEPTALEADTLRASVLVSRDDTHLSADGDSTSVVDIQNGWLKLPILTYQFPADSTTQVYALPGADSLDIFRAEFQTSLRDAKARFESVGFVRVTATSDVAADSIHVWGLKR